MVNCCDSLTVALSLSAHPSSAGFGLYSSASPEYHQAFSGGTGFSGVLPSLAHRGVCPAVHKGSSMLPAYPANCRIGYPSLNHRIHRSLRFASFTQARLSPCGHCRCRPGDTLRSRSRESRHRLSYRLTHLVLLRRAWIYD